MAVKHFIFTSESVNEGHPVRARTQGHAGGGEERRGEMRGLGGREGEQREGGRVAAGWGTACGRSG